MLILLSSLHVGLAYFCWSLSELMELWLAKIRLLLFGPSPSHSVLMKKKTDKLIWESIPWYLRPSLTQRKRGEIFKTFEIFMLPPGNTVTLFSDGGRRMSTKSRCGWCGCQVCIKAWLWRSSARCSPLPSAPLSSRMALSCPMINQSNCRKAGQDQ